MADTCIVCDNAPRFVEEANARVCAVCVMAFKFTQDQIDLLTEHAKEMDSLRQQLRDAERRGFERGVREAAEVAGERARNWSERGLGFERMAAMDIHSRILALTNTSAIPNGSVPAREVGDG